MFLLTTSFFKCTGSSQNMWSVVPQFLHTGLSEALKCPCHLVQFFHILECRFFFGLWDHRLVDTRLEGGVRHWLLQTCRTPSTPETAFQFRLFISKLIYGKYIHCVDVTCDTFLETLYYFYQVFLCQLTALGRMWCGCHALSGILFLFQELEPIMLRLVTAKMVK